MLDLAPLDLLWYAPLKWRKEREGGGGGGDRPKKCTAILNFINLEPSLTHAKFHPNWFCSCTQVEKKGAKFCPSQASSHTQRKIWIAWQKLLQLTILLYVKLITLTRHFSNFKFIPSAKFNPTLSSSHTQIEKDR